MPLDVSVIKNQIDAILEQYTTLRKSSRHSDCSDLDGTLISGAITRLAAAIDRFAPPGSRYLKNQEALLKSYGSNNPQVLAPVAGILTSLRDDITAGYLATMTELVHADVFQDFLEMAEHLLGEGYKDPAAVVAGSVLEEHLRKLCSKHAVVTTSGSKPKKAEMMNSDLAGVPAYSKTDQKNVTAWLGIRNDAAHGNYTAYRPEQVALLIQSIRDFTTRIPA